MDTTITAQPWQGQQSDIRESRLNIRANTPFFLIHYPTSWEFVKSGKSGEFLPQFGELREAAGINGVRQTSNGIDSKLARVHYQDNGHLILDYKEFHYLKRYPAIGGYFYVLRFSTPKQIGKNVFWSIDNKAYNAWRRTLIEDQIIDPPEPEIINMIINQYQTRINRNIKNQHIPELKNQLDVWQQHLAAMKSAHNKLVKAQNVE